MEQDTLVAVENLADEIQALFNVEFPALGIFVEVVQGTYSAKVVLNSLVMDSVDMITVGASGRVLVQQYSSQASLVCENILNATCKAKNVFQAIKDSSLFAVAVGNKTAAKVTGGWVLDAHLHNF